MAQQCHCSDYDLYVDKKVGAGKAKDRRKTKEKC
jgi:hypothetical protein